MFASGKDTTTTRRNSTNFRLGKDGGILPGLASHERRFGIANYPKQSLMSLAGRVRGDRISAAIFQSPTPANPTITADQDSPESNLPPAGRRSAETFSLELSCRSTNAVIHYTLDGRLPNRKSSVYSPPISVTNSVCVRARAYEDGLLPGPPQSAAFVLLATNLQKFTTSLPVLVMETLGSDRAASLRSSSVQLSFYEPSDGRTWLTNRPAMTTRGGFTFVVRLQTLNASAWVAMQFRMR